jgi:hypothetical protein
MTDRVLRRHSSPKSITLWFCPVCGRVELSPVEPAIACYGTWRAGVAIYDGKTSDHDPTEWERIEYRRLGASDA